MVLLMALQPGRWKTTEKVSFVTIVLRKHQASQMPSSKEPHLAHKPYVPDPCINPTEESWHPLTKTPPAPVSYPIPNCHHLTNLLQSSLYTYCNIFHPACFWDRLRSAATAFERLHFYLCRWCQHFSPYQPNWISQPSYIQSSSNCHLALPLW